MVIPPCQHHRPAFQRRDQESLLAAVDVQVLVGGNFVAAQAAICFGSGFSSEDVQRMSLLGQKDANIILTVNGPETTSRYQGTGMEHRSILEARGKLLACYFGE